ncbi:MAG: ArsI/CadI family heavy metal resistance metalloenzyme [Enhygromyxa sp.]
MKTQNTSAVEFATKMRVHVALACADVERSTAFYSELFGQAPTKVREGYAKFEVAEPPLNLTLNDSPEPPRQAFPAHFGVQVKSTGEVMTKLAAMTRAGFGARTEEGVGCCYAVQDKAWFEDPDGNNWEVFVVTEADIPEHSRPSADDPAVEAQAPCCAPSCCQ